MKGTKIMKNLPESGRIVLIMLNIFKSRCPNGIDYSIDRPTYSLCRDYNAITDSFSRPIIKQLHGKNLSSDLIEVFTNHSITKICWDKEITTTIIDSLLAEVGIESSNSLFLDLRDLLKVKGYPHGNLTTAARSFGIMHCPKPNVNSLPKLKKRFFAFSKIVREINKIDHLNLIDGIYY